MITEAQQKFIADRRRLVKSWPWVGSGLLMIIVGFWVYLFFRHSLLVNPYRVVNMLEKGSLPSTTLALLAAIGSLSFLTCGVLCVILILFLFAGMSNERRLIEIIDCLREEKHEKTQAIKKEGER